MPGYLLDTVDRAAALVRAAASHAVRLQLDQYHTAMSGGDAIDALLRHEKLIAHVQIADVPGRHQPGTGKQPINEFLAELDRIGYAGYVGLEYRPLGTTDESLAWLDEFSARAI
jgi:hydroxypyruvate isomerase